MSATPFDTHAAVKRLAEAGVTEAQAEALIRRLTAAGMAEAQAEALIRAITDANARADLVTNADLRAAIAELRNDLIRWIVGLILPLYALLIVSLFT